MSLSCVCVCVCVCVCSREGGRPEGTTAEREVGVGREGGRLEGTSDYVYFWVCETLSTTWSIKPLRAKQVS